MPPRRSTDRSHPASQGPPLTHTAISASAGSGKTFQLAHRYIALLARGVPPDRIIAMTFSRKAAGEIFDELAGYLGRAASRPEAAAETAARIGLPSLGVNDFQRLLRAVVKNLHRIHVSTLDSFTVSVVRSFPLELGVTAEFQLMDSGSPEARVVRDEIMARIFAHPDVPESARREFLEAFKLATFGQEEKGLSRNLERFIRGDRATYQAAPDPARWGRMETIWGTPPPWWRPCEELGAVANELMERIAASGWTDSAVERWQTFAEAVFAYSAATPWNRDIAYLFEKLTPVMDQLADGAAELKIGGKTYRLSPEEGRAARTLLRHVMRVEIDRALRRTEGVFRILDQYERLYETAARRRGRLTFDDVHFMLAGGAPGDGAAMMTRDRDAPSRLFIDYRLDCQLDHWLLDEFQDTSDLQWQALENLADEVMQDDSGRRSFFYVGDVKQAIYGWRGGNARLFDRVRKRYGSRIVTEPLDTSYRSCPAVIDTVNAVFDELPADALPAEACRQWAGLWRPHASAEPLRGVAGHAALLEPPCDGGERKPDAEDRMRAAAALIRTLDPVARGLSVAVLVRTNDMGRRAVDGLRRACPGLPVVHEGNAPIADNPVVAAITQLLRLAEHPGDTFARRFLEMSPLAEVFRARGLWGPDLPLRLLHDLHASGAEAFVRHWGGILDEAAPLDRFGRARLADLADAAAMFDAEGGGSGTHFLRFLDGYTTRELPAERSVRVMTVHQSKGLGFDVVILPDLMGRGMTGSGRVDLAARRDPHTSRPRWVLRMPRRCVAEADPVLRAQLDNLDAEACFDELCVLYVALTRARRALYMITAFPGKSAAAVNSAALLKLRLTGDPKPVDGEERVAGGEPLTVLYETGPRTWYETCPARPAEDEPRRTVGTLAAFARRPSRRTRLLRVAPSAQDDTEHSAGWLFAAESREVLAFGRAIHELFEAVTWTEESDAEAIVAAWLAASDDAEDVKRDVCEQFRRAMQAPDVRSALARPDGPVELWREKRFEIVLDGRWVTGAFDRVAIECDAAGRAVHATILDYKSNRIAGPAEFAATAEEYRPQLELYARALSRLRGLPRAAIEPKLLYTRAAAVYPL